MPEYTFDAMMTRTHHTLKEITVQADDLEAAKQIMETGTTRFDNQRGEDHWHLIVGNIDHGCVWEWEVGMLTLFRLDWNERLSADQEQESTA